LKKASFRNFPRTVPGPRQTIDLALNTNLQSVRLTRLKILQFTAILSTVTSNKISHLYLDMMYDDDENLVNYEDKERTAWHKFDELLCNTPFDSLGEVTITHEPSYNPEDVKEQIYAMTPKLRKRLGERLTFTLNQKSLFGGT